MCVELYTVLYLAAAKDYVEYRGLFSKTKLKFLNRQTWQQLEVRVTGGAVVKWWAKWSGRTEDRTRLSNVHL